MAFEFIERKRQVLDRLQKVADELKGLIPELSSDESQKLFESLSELFQADTHGTSSDDLALPTPTEAVLNLLANAPLGLPIGQIVNCLDGKFRTKSNNPTKMLYSIVEQLKTAGKIARDRGGSYRVADPLGRDDPNQSGRATSFQLDQLREINKRMAAANGLDLNKNNDVIRTFWSAKLSPFGATTGSELTFDQAEDLIAELSRDYPLGVAKHVSFIGPTMATAGTVGHKGLRDWFKAAGIAVHVLSANDPLIDTSKLRSAIAKAGGDPCLVVQGDDGRILDQAKITTVEAAKALVTPFLEK